jgi:hypothetical protein
MKRFWICETAMVLFTVTAAGCGGQGSTPVAGGVSSLAPQAAAPLGYGHRKLAGVYDGSIEWSRGNKTYSGTLETILRFDNKNIRGPFRITANGKTNPFRFYGRIKSKTSQEAVVVFLVYDTKGGYLTGSGTISNGTFAGNANAKQGGDGPSVVLQFSATKGKSG